MCECCIQLLSQNGAVRQQTAGAQRAQLEVDGYHAGDRLHFCVTGSTFVRIMLHEQIAPALLYLPHGEFCFPIPDGEHLRGFAPGTFHGAQQIIMEAAAPEEIAQYRNLCLNPLDRRLPQEVVDPDAPEWSNPTDSQAIADGMVECFPHAYANRVTRNEGSFFARNAIDGVANKGGHGDWPYHTWGGAVHQDLSFTVYFGRAIKTDKIALSLRSDYAINEKGQEHDTYWHTAIVEFSDHSEIEIYPQKTGESQEFCFPPKTTEWVKFKRMDPMQTPQSQNFAALNQFEVWGADLRF